jgi:hypothetical protein
MKAGKNTLKLCAMNAVNLFTADARRPVVPGSRA